MTEGTAIAADGVRKAKRAARLWMIGFFIALFAFETAREIAVIASYDEPNLATLATVMKWNGLVWAEGRWVRTDGGERLTPNMVRIDCDPDTRKCDEMWVHSNDTYITGPDRETWDATFGNDVVTYVKDYACDSYLVRIDTKLEKASQVRTIKEPQTGNCKSLRDKRIEMELGNGWQERIDPFKEHFVPVLWLLGKVLRAV